MRIPSFGVCLEALLVAPQRFSKIALQSMGTRELVQRRPLTLPKPNLP